MAEQPKKLRVFGWTSYQGSKGTHRCIMAAPSKAAVARAAGVTSPARLWNLCETGNDVEAAQARSLPHTILMQPYHTIATETWYTTDGKRAPAPKPKRSPKPGKMTKADCYETATAPVSDIETLIDELDQIEADAPKSMKLTLSEARAHLRLAVDKLLELEP